jgi:hypothetical protein
MTITLSNTAVTATSATFGFAGLAGDGTIDLQISPRVDFQFCVCPIYSIARGGAYTAPGLNQRSTLYARARNRLANGTVDDWSPVIGFRTADATARVTAPGLVLMDLATIVKPEPILAFVDSNAETLPGYPLENLAIDAPVAWRGVKGGGVHSFVFQTGGSPVDTFALLRANAPEATTVTISGGATMAAALSGSPTFTTGALPFRASANLERRAGYHGIFRLDAPQSFPWWRVTIAAALPGDMIHLEHLVVGLNRVTKNHSVDKSETPTTQTTVDRRRSGVVDRVFGIPMRKVDFELSMLTEQQYETNYGDLVYHENEAMLVIPNSKAGAFLHDRILYGDMQGSRISNPFSPRFTRGFTINSII